MKNKSFAIFILTHGRPHNIATLQALQKANCKAKIYFVIDNEDDQAEEYFKTYGKENVIQFDKCYANFSQIAINENSEVMYCCHKPYEIIGRLDDKDIWEKRERFQTNMQMCDVPCRLTAPNNFVQSLQDAPSDAAFI